MIMKIGDYDVLIDKEDYPRISHLKWHINDQGYAVWRGVKDGKKQTIRMHRLINQTPVGKVTDHLNHNRLDNRRNNLRTCTQAENTLNRKNPGKGYWYQKQNGNWVVELSGNHIGCFDTEQEAQEVVKLVRSGGTYVRPERTICKYGHSLRDAYDYGKGKLCRKCQSERSRKYYLRRRNQHGGNS